MSDARYYHLEMRTFAGLPVLLILFGSLTGCGLGVTGAPSPAAPLNLTGNWQIQSVNTASGPAANNVLLLGALVSSGTHVTGMFRYTDLAAGNICGPISQVITLSGTLDTSQSLSQSVTLTSAVFSGETLTAQLTFPKVTTGSAAGTIQVTGGNCPLVSAQAVALEYPAVSGTYSGTLTLTPNTSTGGPATGTAALTVTQSTTPSSDGEFPLTGTLAFTSGNCSVSTPLTGSASGPFVSLLSNINPLTATSFVTLVAANLPQNPVTTPQLQAGSILYYPSPCGSSLSSTSNYTGTLVRQ